MYIHASRDARDGFFALDYSHNPRDRQRSQQTLSAPEGTEISSPNDNL